MQQDEYDDDEYDVYDEYDEYDDHVGSANAQQDEYVNHVWRRDVYDEYDEYDELALTGCPLFVWCL